MNVHRFLALSTSAVVFAACSAGSSSIAPHPAATSAQTSAANHAPNAVLTLSFPKNLVHVRSKAAASARRSPKFVDPSGGTYLEVAVYNTTTGTTYMAATDLPVSLDSTASESISLYLQPGYDYITVAESLGVLNSGQAGYLLAQGTASKSVAEGSPNTLSLTMQLVQGTVFNEGAGPAVIDDPTNVYSVGDMQTTTGSYGCIANGSPLYILPIDENGNSAFTQSTTPGNTSPGLGVPVGSLTYPSENGGTSTLVPNALGGYYVAFDSAADPIDLTASYSSILLDPYPYEMVNGAIPTIGGSSATYDFTLIENGTGLCNEG